MNDFARYCKNRIKYSFFRMIFFAIIGLIIYAISSKLNLFQNKVYALENTTIYGSNTGGNLGNSGYLNYWKESGGLFATTLNTVNADTSWGIYFYINKTSAVGKVYKVRINFNDYDFLKTVNASYIQVIGFNGSENIGQCNILSFSLLNQGGSNNQAKGVEFTYNCLEPSNYKYIGIIKYDDNNNRLRTTTISWRLNNVQWEEVEDTQAQQIIINQTQNTNNIINNQNENTQNIIAGQSSQADRIIQNQNDIAEQQHEDQKVCTLYDKTSIKDDGKYLNNQGNFINDNGFGITDYISIYNSDVTFTNLPYNWGYTCFYNKDKSVISCNYSNTLENYSIPSNAYYFRMTIAKSYNLPTASVCQNGNQAITETNKNIFTSILDLPNQISTMLQGLFLPTQNDLMDLLDDLLDWAEEKFGVLGQLLSITTTFVEKFYLIDDSADVVINIPEITIPNFEEETPIIQQQTFNWTELLEDRESIYTLWQFYLDFIDVIIIIAFLHFCESVYEDIMEERHIDGNNIYESEGESYKVNDTTGELTDHRYWRKRSNRV